MQSDSVLIEAGWTGELPISHFSPFFMDYAEMESPTEHGEYYYFDGELEEEKGGHVQMDTFHIISVVIYCISFALGVIGNGLVIWITGFKTKRTVKSLWLMNLAVADFVFVLFLPLSIDYVVRSFHWSFGQVMCKLNSFVLVLNMYASVFFLTVISIDRYLSLGDLGRRWRCSTVGRAWVLCGCVWLTSAGLSSPVLVFRDTFEFRGQTVCYNNFHEHDADTAAMRHTVMVAVRTTVGFLLPFSAITVTGVLLAYRVHRSGSVRLSTFSKMMSAVILAFFLCWAPFHIFSLMELSVHSSRTLLHVLQAGFPLVTSLAFFNSCINPLLYVLCNKKVRQLLRSSCLNITKQSLRELSQSVSVTECVTVPGNVPSEASVAMTKL
uniref:G-protein coupled receptors family 1 profile domain-containing protein n=1 Tax=Denticeps clupeoides TaxID=299321 RepID=A0AAY4EXZ6_9TELE